MMGGRSRSAAPSFKLAKLAIPVAGGGGGAGFQYNDDDDGSSQMLTPVPGDSEATVQPRVPNGPGGYANNEGAYNSTEQMNMMTDDIRQALTNMRIQPSPAPGQPRSRSTSSAAYANGDDLSQLQRLSISQDEHAVSSADNSRPGSMHEIGGLVVDPSDLTLIKNLGEGAGGSVDLVRYEKDGSIMARKVSNPSAQR